MKYLVFMWEAMEASGGARDLIGEAGSLTEVR